MKVRPTIKGYQGYKDHKQDIKVKTDLACTYTEGPLTLTPAINFIKERPLYWMCAGYEIKSDLSVHAAYNTNYRAVSAGLAYKGSRLNVYAHDHKLKNMRAIGLSFSLARNW